MDSPREPFETMHRHGPSILSSRYKVSLEVNNMLPGEMITHPYMHVFGWSDSALIVVQSSSEVSFHLTFLGWNFFFFSTTAFIISIWDSLHIRNTTPTFNLNYLRALSLSPLFCQIGSLIKEWSFHREDQGYVKLGAWLPSVILSNNCFVLCQNPEPGLGCREGVCQDGTLDIGGETAG